MEIETIFREEKTNKYLVHPNSMLEKKKKKPEFRWIPPEALWELAELLTEAHDGKHSDEKWRRMEIEDHTDAAKRHLAKWDMGSYSDPEYGKSHLVHALARLSFAVALLSEQHTERER